MRFLISKWILLFTLILISACAQSPTSQTSESCPDAAINLPPYSPTDTQGFVGIQGDQFVIDGEPFFARGINYYPSRFPWRRFLTQTNMATVDQELALLQSVGLNTLRIFLWNEALFDCPTSGAHPNAEAFARLEGVIQRAADHGFRLIVTLNDLADFDRYPLYDSPDYIEAQTRFIVERYRDEAAILAWDVRNEGDIDYGSNNILRMRFPRTVVIAWLAHTSALVREIDDRHLITAGWLYDNESTIPYVDFVSFHHWTDGNAARDRITRLQAATDKPVLVEEFGYNTFLYSEETQAETIGTVIDAVDETGAAGWLIWTAFDFPTDATCVPPACPSVDNAEHHFGLWRTDYSPKPAVAVIEASRIP